MSEKRYTEYESIHCGMLPEKGRFRFAPNGLGWKSASGKTTVISSDDLKKLSWSRAARGYQLRVQCKDNTVHRFDGFKSEVSTMIVSNVSDWSLVIDLFAV